MNATPAKKSKKTAQQSELSQPDPGTTVVPDSDAVTETVASPAATAEDSGDDSTRDSARQGINAFTPDTQNVEDLFPTEASPAGQASGTQSSGVPPTAAHAPAAHAPAAHAPAAHAPAAHAPAAHAPAAQPQPRPRIRVAAIIWGTLITALGVLATVLGAEPWRQINFAETVWSLPPAASAAIAIAAVGGIIVLAALVRLLARLGERDSLGR